MDVLRIAAEVEQIVLRDAHVLDELPWRVFESSGLRAPPVLRDIADAFVERNVRLFPVKKAHKLLSKRIQWLAHGASLCSKRTTAVCGSQV